MRLKNTMANKTLEVFYVPEHDELVIVQFAMKEGLYTPVALYADGLEEGAEICMDDLEYIGEL